MDSVRFLPPNGATWQPVGQWTRDDWTCWLSQHHWTPSQITQYLDFDRYHFGFGVTKDRRRAVESDYGSPDVKWIYTPTPKGVTLHACQTANVLWGGAAGGTKSFSARWEALRCCDSREDFRAIIVRREREELKRTHLDKLDRETQRLNSAFGAEVFRVGGNPPVLSHTRTLAKMIFAHCNNAGDENKYLSEDYDLFLGDEATQLLAQQIIGIAGRVRNDPKLGLLGRMILTTNPGGPAHDYCVTRFMEKNPALFDDPKYDPDDYTFIPSALYDNPFYMDPDGTYLTYEKRLSAYNPERRRQLLNGDWSVVAGQFFKDFNVAGRVQELTIPDATPRVCALHWGFFTSGILLWAAILPDGRLYIEREYAFSEQVAADVAMKAGEHRTAITFGNPPSDIPEDQMGEDVVETFYVHGIPVIRSDHDPVSGWQRLQHWLRPRNGAVQLIIHPSCLSLLRSVPHLTQSRTNPEDVNEESETRGAKALRYLVMSRPSPVQIEKRPEGPDLSRLAERDQRDVRREMRQEDRERQGNVSAYGLGEFWD